MTIEQITKQLRHRPFHPFTVHLADGRAFRVEHPEFIARSPSGRVIMVAAPDGQSFEIIDLLLVTSLTVDQGTDQAAA